MSARQKNGLHYARNQGFLSLWCSAAGGVAVIWQHIHPISIQAHLTQWIPKAMACRFCTVLPLHLWWSDPFGNVSQSYDQQHHLQCQKLEQIGAASTKASKFVFRVIYHIHFPTSLHQNDNDTSCLSFSASFHHNKFHITSLYRERVLQTSIPNGSVTCDISTRPFCSAKAPEMPTPLLATSLSHLLVLVAWNAVIYAFQPRSRTPLAKVQPDLQADLGWAKCGWGCWGLQPEGCNAQACANGSTNENL